MNLSQIQRRAFWIALATMSGVLGLLLCYWTAVSRGDLPSPVQPIVAQKNNSEPEKVTVIGRDIPTTKKSQAEAAGPHRDGAEAPPATPAKTLEPEITRSPSLLETQDKPKPSASVDPRPNTPLSQKSAAPDQIQRPEPPKPAVAPPPTAPASPEVSPKPNDLELARNWLVNTNDRPVIRLLYDPADIVRLAQAGRGLIIANGSAKTPLRHIYLQPGSNGAPIFAPFTKQVAERFSSYSLRLEPSPGLDHLTAALPAYFPSGEFNLEFVFDPRLALDILAQVAAASHGLNENEARHAVFEGELTVNGTQPGCRLLHIRAETKAVTGSDCVTALPQR